MRCGTCIYYADRVGICCNPEGEMNTQPMAYDDGCKDWKARTPQSANTRIMTREEVLNLRHHKGCFVWVEWKEIGESKLACLQVFGESSDPEGMYYIDFDTPFDISSVEIGKYGYSWRCWTHKPTPAAREATVWKNGQHATIYDE